MLVLSRRENETIRIGDGIVVTIIRISGCVVRVGIDAPKDVKVIRGELEHYREPAVDPAGPPRIIDQSQIGKPATTPPIQVKKKP